MVNRVWSWHFGKGLAGNPNNFGGTGVLPTHPLLLDYLADWFKTNGWSVKKLNRLIVSSEVYRRSSRHPYPEQLEARDSGNNLYAAFTPRRLTAEELRDAMLVASGEMNYQVGGIPARPDMNTEVAIQPRQIMAEPHLFLNRIQSQRCETAEASMPSELAGCGILSSKSLISRAPIIPVSYAKHRLSHRRL